MTKSKAQKFNLIFLILFLVTIANVYISENISMVALSLATAIAWLIFKFNVRMANGIEERESKTGEVYGAQSKQLRPSKSTSKRGKEDIGSFLSSQDQDEIVAPFQPEQSTRTVVTDTTHREGSSSSSSSTGSDNSDSSCD